MNLSYGIDKVLAYIVRKGEAQYLIKWKGNDAPRSRGSRKINLIAPTN